MIAQLVHGYLDLAKNGSEQTWADDFAGVDGHDGCPAIWMFEECVAPPNSEHLEANLPERAYQLPACDAGQPCHTEIC